MLLSLLNAALARFPSLLLMSSSEPPSWVTVPPRYTNFDTSPSSSPSTRLDLSASEVVPAHNHGLCCVYSESHFFCLSSQLADFRLDMPSVTNTKILFLAQVKFSTYKQYIRVKNVIKDILIS